MSESSINTIARHMAAESHSSSGKKNTDDRAQVAPHLLVPVSNHSKAGDGLNYLTRFFTEKESVHLTLMHIPPSQAAVWVEETSYESLDVMETRAAAADRRGIKVVDDAKRKLIAAGFKEENLEAKVAPPQVSKAHDIIREAREKRYDAVVLGRRVQVGLGDIMDPSICRELLEGLRQLISFPLWVCRLPGIDHTDVLLCVDGSDPSDRMADHVGYVLSHEPGHRVTVFHVYNPSKTDPMDGEAVVENAVRVLREAGLTEDRIDRVVVRSANAKRRIMEEYAAGTYSAVAIGSAGAGRGFWDKLFVGSVARSVFKELQGAALWVCF